MSIVPSHLHGKQHNKVWGQNDAISYHNGILCTNSQTILTFDPCLFSYSSFPLCFLSMLYLFICNFKSLLKYLAGIVCTPNINTFRKRFIVLVRYTLVINQLKNNNNITNRNTGQNSYKGHSEYCSISMK